MIMKRALLILAMTAEASACGPTHSSPATQTYTIASRQPAQPRSSTKTMDQEESHMWMTVGERRFAITLTDNDAARAFASQLPLTLDMSELNGNEKHAELPKALPADASRPGTIRNGDLMLYGTNTFVIFYSTFESSYSYTPLGRVDDPSDLPAALGRRGVRGVFAKDQLCLTQRVPTEVTSSGTEVSREQPFPKLENRAERFDTRPVLPATFFSYESNT